MELPYAYECPFWKTGKSSPDVWIEKTKKLIIKAGGDHIIESYGSEHSTGRAAFMIAFAIGEDKFKLVWPVLLIRDDSEMRAAKIQAATMLYHDVKNKCVKAMVFGARTAFFEHLMIEDGRSLSEVSDQELLDKIPGNILTYKDSK